METSPFFLKLGVNDRHCQGPDECVCGERNGTGSSTVARHHWAIVGEYVRVSESVVYLSQGHDGTVVELRDVTGETRYTLSARYYVSCGVLRGSGTRCARWVTTP